MKNEKWMGKKGAAFAAVAAAAIGAVGAIPLSGLMFSFFIPVFQLG